MKILFTGGTSRQVKEPHERGNSGTTKIDVPEYIVSSLRAQGHTVEWRAVRPGEDLSSFDLLWVCWCPWLSRGTPNTYGAMYAWTSGVPMVVFLDDWAHHQGFSHMRTIAKKPDTYLPRTDFFGGALKHTEAELLEYLPLVKPAIQQMVSVDQWPLDRITVVTPQYGFGSTDVVKASPDFVGNDVDMFKLDPSSYVIERELSGWQDVVMAAGDKISRWALASLSPQDDWVNKQGFGWPVNYYGSRKLKAPRLKTEFDIFTEYAYSKGVLAPPYTRLKGAHWFRSRHLYAALSGSVLFCDPSDCVLPVWYKPGEIERMDDLTRASLAADQGSAVLTRIWSKDKFDEQVQRVSIWTAGKR